MRSYARLYALFAVNMPDGVTRREAMAAVWPGKEQAVVANRLRVALSEFRKELGAAFREEHKLIGFDPEHVEVDLWRLLDQLARVGDEVDETAEAENLESLLPSLGLRVLPEMEDEWLEPIQSQWAQAAEAALMRLIQLAFGAQKPGLAARAAEAGLQHDPYSDKFWSALMRAKIALGEASEATARFTAARKRLREDFDAEFDDATLDVARTLRQGFTPRQRSEERLIEFRARLFDRIFESDIEVAAAIINSKMAVAPVVDFLDVSLPMIERILEVAEEGSQPWLRALFRKFTAEAGINHAQECLVLMEQLRRYEDRLELHQLVGLEIFGSFALFQVRRYDEAIAAIRHANKLLLEAGDEYQAARCYTNLASYHWHQGMYDEALEMYKVSFNAEEGRTGFDPETSRGVILSNIAFVHLFCGREAQALPLARQSLEIYRRFQYERSMPMALPLGGYLEYFVKSSVKGVDLMVQGIRSGFRRDHIRGVQIALDFAAGMFVLGGMPDHALATFEYAGDWRTRTNHHRSVAEQGFLKRYLDQCPAPPKTVPFNIKDEPRAFLNALIYALRQLPVSA